MAYAMATAMAMIARIPTTTYRVHGLPVQSSIPHRPLAARGESLASHRDGRGAPPARRDDREYREYLSEEQRRRRGCIARRMQPDFHHGLLSVVSVMALLTACGADQRRTGSAQTAGSNPVTGNPVDWFIDRAEETGLRFTYFNGMSGEFYFPEMLPAGIALLDYDNDGDLDVYVVQGQMLGPGKTLSQAIIRPASLPLKGRLYRNDLQVQPDGTRTLHFTDVTERSGIDAHGYGMGVAAGDFNNDGCVDLY